jgi:predicted DNA-binding antitoxin AbrB/MazE fold protein
MTFDFITHKELRSSLESDYQEIQACLSSKCWKAVHVLSGNIIEAVLVDFLIASDYEKKTSADPLKLTFSQLIEICQKQGFISQKTTELCNVVKSYRNLIHPGRCIRLEESVDEPGAKIAQALVDLVVNEIAAKRSEQFGYTAEQVVAKLVKDPSASAIVSHFLEGVSEYELEQLLFTVLPKRHFEVIGNMEAEYNYGDPDSSTHYYRISISLEDCYRKAVSQASEKVKIKAAKRYVEILRQESELVVIRYGQGLFKALDLIYLSEGERNIVKQYIASNLKENVKDWLAPLEGIGKHLTQEDVVSFLDPLIRAYVLCDDDDSKNIKNVIISQIILANDALQDVAIKRINDWIDRHKKQSQLIAHDKLEILRNEIVWDLPF